MNCSIRGQLYKLKTKHVNIDRSKNPLLQVVRPIEIYIPKTAQYTQSSTDDNFEYQKNQHSGERILGKLVGDWKECGFQLIPGTCELRCFPYEKSSGENTAEKSYSVLIGIVQSYTRVSAGPFVETAEDRNGERLRLHTIELEIQVKDAS